MVKQTENEFVIFKHKTLAIDSIGVTHGVHACQMKI